MKADEVVLRFLHSIGRPAEAEQYLSLFRAARPESFAIIAVSRTVVRAAAGALVTDLRFLAQLGLTPVVVLGLTDGGGDQAASLIARMSPELDCQLGEPGDAGEIARTGSIPVLRPRGRRIAERFASLAELATALATRKVVFVGRRSGLQPTDRPSPSLVDITTEYEELARPGVLPAKQAALLASVRTLLASVPHRMTVAVTSPLDLLRELFTERGAGTLLRLGSRVTRYTGYADLDRERLAGLVEHAFGRRLAPDFFDRKAASVYLADEYRGAAIIEAGGLAGYLSKFAVGLAARGEGVGRDLWKALAADYPRLIWRARANNPISGWYAQLADGLHRTDRWTIYWRGMPAGKIPAAIELAGGAPLDFLD